MRGSTNATWETFEKYEQLVNYVDFDFSAKQADWTEIGGTFEYTEDGLYQAGSGTKGTDTTHASYYGKILSIPVNITKESFKFTCTHKVYTSSNNQIGVLKIFLCVDGNPVAEVRRADEWTGSKNQHCSAWHNPQFWGGVGSTDRLFQTSESASLNGIVRTDEISFDGTNIKFSVGGTTGSTTISLAKNIDEIQIRFLGTSSSSYPIAEMLVSDLMCFNHDDITTLAEKAGITASSIDDILTVSDTLLANKDAVNFMVARCTGTFMISAVENETFITALNNSEYKTVVQENEHWAKFLATVA